MSRCAGQMLSGDHYQAIFEASPDGYLVVDQQGTIRSANRQAERMFGWTRADLVGESVDLLVPDSLRDAHHRHRSHFAADPRARPMGVGLELHGQRKDGSTFPVEISLSPWDGEDTGPHVICTIRDVSDYRRLRNFSEGALRASEDERHRIARELHDDTAQRLATLILRVRGLAAEDDAVARATLWESVRQEIVDAATGVQRMARGLRPPELEEVGLSLAIQAHLRNLRETGALNSVGTLEDVGGGLDVTTKLALYRIVQEALSNVRRHSGTDQAHVSLFEADGQIVAEVRDDGIGFVSTRSPVAGAGLGLLGMQERASMIGARLEIDSQPDEGTLVRVTLPQEHSKAEDG